MIMGAMKTMATDVLEIMANLLPLHLLVNKLRFHAALQLATLPSSHLRYKPIKNAAK